MYALQTRTNSLQFKTHFGQDDARPRSTSFSLPSTSSKSEADDDQVLWKFNFGRRGGRAGPRVRKMRLREYKALEEEERRWNFSKTDRVVRTQDVPEELRTTVMMRGIPNEYTRDDILHVLQRHDFGEINFLYLLMNLNTGLSAGYCFINFRFPEDALEFKSAFTGHTFCDSKPEDTVQVRWRFPIQGFASHADKFKNAHVTHAKLPAQFRPTLVRGGKLVAFPEIRKKYVQLRRKRKMYKLSETTRKN